jgi:hypothetical protein
LAEVLEALDTDEPGDALHYVRLFSDDDDLNQGLTAEIIRSQHLTERLEYLQVGSYAAVVTAGTPTHGGWCTDVYNRYCRNMGLCVTHSHTNTLACENNQGCTHV